MTNTLGLEKIEIMYTFYGNVDEIKKIIHTDSRSILYRLNVCRGITHEIKYEDTDYINSNIKHFITLIYHLYKEDFLINKNKLIDLLNRVDSEIHNYYSVKQIAKETKYKIYSPKSSSCLIGTVGESFCRTVKSDFIKRNLKDFIPIHIELNTNFHKYFLKKKTSGISEELYLINE